MTVVGEDLYHLSMPTHLSLDAHLDTLARSGAALRDTAAKAGLDALVPTCPSWDVSKLVAHQGMVHRWAAAHLRGDTDSRAQDALDEAATVPDLLAWYSDGLEALMDKIRTTPDEATAVVFLKDAPPPRTFWARRQAHETTMHGVDALAALLGRWPSSADVSIDPAVAADGIDELLRGFVTRKKGRLRSAEPYTVAIKTGDTGHAWTVRVSDGPVETTVDAGERTDAVMSGSAVQLYLGLWNRSDEIKAEGRPDILTEWRSSVRVTWSSGSHRADVHR